MEKSSGIHYLQSRHIQEVKLWDVSNGNSILKALINPGQCSWIMLTIHGLLSRKMGAPLQLFAHVWLGKLYITNAISYFSMLFVTGWEKDALMWLQCYSRLSQQFEMDIPLATSNLCRWNQVFSKNVCICTGMYIAMSMTDNLCILMLSQFWIIHSAQPKHEREIMGKAQNPAKQPKISPPTYNEQKCFIETLQSLSSHSAVLKAWPTVEHLSCTIADKSCPFNTNAIHSWQKRARGQSSWPEGLSTGIWVSFQSNLSSVRVSEGMYHVFEHQKGCIISSQFGAVSQTKLDSPSHLED